MITKTPSFETTDGNTFKRLGLAQAHELTLLFKSEEKLTPVTVADLITKHAKVVVDILTTTENSRARARAVNGATRKRKPAGRPGVLAPEPAA